MHANTIDEVVGAFEIILTQSFVANSRLGYFAALYLKVTRLVREKVRLGDYFEDNERLEKLDVIFANRYLDALTAYHSGKPLTQAWQLAFDACKDSSVTVVQLLLMSCDAHIGLDLPVAVAEVAEGNADESLHRDFLKLNPLLSSLVPKVSEEIDEISPLIGFVNRYFSFFSNGIIDFSMDIARDKAWDNAVWLAPQSGEELQTSIQQLDTSVTRFSHTIYHPGCVFSPILWLIHLLENKSVRQVIEELND